MIRPSATWRRSDAVVVEASIHGRVLGLHLLRLDAEIVIVPTATARPALDAIAVPFAAPPPGPPSPARAVRHGDALADAVRLIGESAATLDAARALRDGR